MHISWVAFQMKVLPNRSINSHCKKPNFYNGTLKEQLFKYLSNNFLFNYNFYVFNNGQRCLQLLVKLTSQEKGCLMFTIPEAFFIGYISYKKWSKFMKNNFYNRNIFMKMQCRFIFQYINFLKSHYSVWEGKMHLKAQLTVGASKV